MSYTIIGADGKEYGPVSENDVRQWIAEVRLNAQSMAKGPGDAQFHPLSEFPEFAAALTAGVPMAAPTAAPWPPDHDYDLDIGECFRRGWGIMKHNFWPAVGVTALVMLILGSMNQVVGLFTRPQMQAMIEQRHITTTGAITFFFCSLVTAPFNVVFRAGMYAYFIKLARGQSATLADAFAGFGPSFMQLLLLGLVEIILTSIGYLCCIVPGIYLTVAWFFATPLVIDKGMGFWEALELSRKMVSKHWFIMLGMLFLCLLLIAGGVLALCVGVFVAMPFGIAALMCAYEAMFSEARIPQGR